MSACVYADVAFLLQAFPGAAVVGPEVWAVNVLGAQAGDYVVGIQGGEYPFVADGASTVQDVADGLLAALGGQMLAAVSPNGVNGLVLQALGLAGLDLTAVGPADGTIEANLISGGVANTASLEFWLEYTKCSLPPCCKVTCKADYTLMHAALAAHWLMYLAGLSGTGGGGAVGDWDRMRLGPAELSRGKSAWSTNPADSVLAKTGPGQLALSLRAKYVFPAMCV
jgi:hypothetical protein